MALRGLRREVLRTGEQVVLVVVLVVVVVVVFLRVHGVVGVLRNYDINNTDSSRYVQTALRPLDERTRTEGGFTSRLWKECHAMTKVTAWRVREGSAQTIPGNSQWREVTQGSQDVSQYSDGDGGLREREMT